jgi:hypothetical protein
MKSADRAAVAVERASDGALDFCVLFFAAWTLVYHICLIAHIGTVVATVAGAVALVPSAWLAVRWQRDPDERPSYAPGPEATAGRSRAKIALRGTNVAAGVGAAALFAWSTSGWDEIWLLWVVAAVAGLAASLLLPDERARPARDVAEPTRWPGAAAALAWAVGLATLSLFLIRSSGDDAFYVHTSSWVAANGTFPLRDTMFTNQELPAVIYPPVASFEALVGVTAPLTGLSVPTITYYGLALLGSVLAALASWRLLRTWNTGNPAIALSVAMSFLLLDAAGPRLLGSSFIGRIWQGKVVFLIVLVPLLWTFLVRYAERSHPKWLVLLAAGGIAGVGLTTTGVFIVPIVVAAGVAPLALRAPWKALAGLVAGSFYALAAGLAILAIGGRHAQIYTEADVRLPRLLRFILGDGALAFVAVAALLVAPALIPNARGARGAAAVVLLVTCLYAPGVPLLLFHATGLGEVLWRLVWAIPVAALVGVLATCPFPRSSPWPLRLGAAAGLVAVLAVFGTAVWAAPGGQTIASRPTLKRFPGELAAARNVLAVGRPGDVILAPGPVSQTILVLSGDVTVVAPRPFYARALRDVPGGHAQERLVLASFADRGLGPPEEFLGANVDSVTASDVVRSLREVGVDLACPATDPDAARVLESAGYRRVLVLHRLTCFRRTAPGANS